MPNFTGGFSCLPAPKIDADLTFVLPFNFVRLDHNNTAMFTTKSLLSCVSLFIIGNAQNTFRALHLVPNPTFLPPALPFIRNPVCASIEGHVDETFNSFMKNCACWAKDCQIAPSCHDDAPVILHIILKIYLQPLAVEACISLDVAIRAVVELVHGKLVLPAAVDASITTLEGLSIYGQSISSVLGLSTFAVPFVGVEAFIQLFLKIDVSALIKVGISDISAGIVVAIMPILLVLIFCLSVNIHIG